ncbi:helix-turn-helix transcriptional regulator [Asanoa sp. WMMD1127]|uniref:helix-turn-helix domain-containing protein n=1 Tax=Asanoa sp. WMMD1127 TaxID=3016107 RepID=UPI0024179573|nr:helix-turn-helix transcriptional regulator [Asanoa sp. WMMD1127]MDG4822620.1 helix-turn-helix transcriptional regulator [Asanoa sp. WMMD1127]
MPQRIGPTKLPAAGLVRAARRRADFSQRELARKSAAAQGTIARIESGDLTPSLAMIEKLLGACGFQLVAVDHEGCVLRPMRDTEDTLDGAGRRYPAHLDVILDPLPGEWWADIYGLARPPETFYRDRARRDRQRRRSQWEVRVKKYRFVPPPPTARGFYA